MKKNNIYIRDIGGKKPLMLYWKIKCNTYFGTKIIFCVNIFNKLILIYLFVPCT